MGGGWQALVAYINLGCYYVFGLPLGFAFGYWLHWGVKARDQSALLSYWAVFILWAFYNGLVNVQGIWAGMLCGTAAQTLVLLAVVWKTNWKSEVTKLVMLERIRLIARARAPP